MTALRSRWATTEQRQRDCREQPDSGSVRDHIRQNRSAAACIPKKPIPRNRLRSNGFVVAGLVGCGDEESGSERPVVRRLRTRMNPESAGTAVIAVWTAWGYFFDLNVPSLLSYVYVVSVGAYLYFVLLSFSHLLSLMPLSITTSNSALSSLPGPFLALPRASG